jgi:hypothetical protein
VVCNLFAMKSFFTQYTGDPRNPKLFAETLVEVGITDQMMFAVNEKQWLIKTEDSSFWRCEKTPHESRAIVGTFINEQLGPLCQLESFLNQALPWGTTLWESQTSDDYDSDAENTDSASGCIKRKKRVAGNKASKSILSSTLGQFQGMAGQVCVR